MTSQPPRLFKLLMIGDSGVGKSCLLLRFCDDTFTDSFITTIGIDFKIKQLEINGQRIKLQIWDTAGQERFRTITTAYYRGAMGIFLIYDVCDEQTFANIRNWIRSIREHTNKTELLLIGNKCDRTDHKKITTEAGQELADEYGIKFFETSAKTDTNVQEAFMQIAIDILNNSAREERQSISHREMTEKARNNETRKCNCNLL